MPLIGNDISPAFESLPTRQEFSGDGSTTTFTLNQTVSSEQDIVVSVDGVVQEPTGAYTVPDGTTLTFTAAPSNKIPPIALPTASPLALLSACFS